MCGVGADWRRSVGCLMSTSLVGRGITHRLLASLGISCFSRAVLDCAGLWPRSAGIEISVQALQFVTGKSLTALVLDAASNSYQFGK